MPTTFLFTTTPTTRYRKLDDRIYILCNHCGHTLKNPEREDWKMTPESRPRSNLFRGASPKHFLTWSATAANHKIQKLSKHLAQNVSKLQVRVDKVLHPPVPNGNVNNQSQASTPSLGTTAARTLPSSSRNVQDAQDHQHLLSVNNVHMAVVHNLSVSRGQKLMRDGDQFPKVDPSAPAQTSPDPDDSWKTFSCSRSRQKFDFEMERKKIAQSLGEGLDIFELTPLATTGSDGGSDDATTGNGRQTLNDSSGSSHDTSVSSGTSFGASTLPARSPHWSRASSLTSTGDTIPLPDEHDNELGAHARSLIPLSQGKDGGDIPAQESIHPDESELSVRIMEEEPELRLASWFHAGIPREIALEVLKNEALGSFIVRESSSRSGCFALSLRVPPEFQPTGIAHYLIIRRNQGYKIKGFTKEFGTLTSLITHHSVMPELLPCPLYRRSPPPSRVSRANSSDFMEPEKLLRPTQNHHWKYTTDF